MSWSSSPTSSKRTGDHISRIIEQTVKTFLHRKVAVTRVRVSIVCVRWRVRTRRPGVELMSYSAEFLIEDYLFLAGSHREKLVDFIMLPCRPIGNVLSIPDIFLYRFALNFSWTGSCLSLRYLTLSKDNDLTTATKNKKQKTKGKKHQND